MSAEPNAWPIHEMPLPQLRKMVESQIDVLKANTSHLNPTQTEGTIAYALELTMCVIVGLIDRLGESPARQG